MKGLICLMLLKCVLPTVIPLNLPNPSVFVVTPSSRTNSDEARSAPFYYPNWRRRMDPPTISTTTMATTTTTVKTPDLIFAEFETDNGDSMKKSIRNLLEKERVKQKSSAVTTASSKSQPIYVPDEDIMDESHENEDTNIASNNNDDTVVYNQFPTSIYLPPPPPTTTTSSPQLENVENIWHIIDSEKQHQYSGKWEEVPVEPTKEQTNSQELKPDNNGEQEENTKTEDHVIDDNFAFPGFATNPGNGAENESRAIRTEQNLRFPYVSLKPFQMKNVKQPNGYSNSKKNNMFNLDNFKDIQHPVRGEVQDVNTIRQPIDRYNPAQPYLPPHEYGSKSKQSSPPAKAVANLVPPPPPPPPKVTGNDFPAPTSYEAFPPFSGPAPDMEPGPPPPVVNPSLSMYQPPSAPSYSAQSDDSDDVTMDLGYQYQKPKSSFRPTLPPLSKPFNGYSYNKPDSSGDDAPSPPASNGGYNYQPPMTMDTHPSMEMDDQDDSHSMPDDKPDFHGYHYNKPPPEDDHGPPVYKPHGPSPFHHDGDYPELIFDKPHGGSGAVKGGKGGNSMKDDGMGMMPPPPPADLKPDMDSGPPVDDHGFPAGFPGDFKFHHDFDDHDFYHHHHHHTTTTTTTTESPRVNRYSYYYLGKKLYYLPLYFSVYFIVYVGALIIKAVLRHKIVYPNSWRPNDTTATFFSKRSLDSWDLSNENLHEVTGKVTKAIGDAAEKYTTKRKIKTKEEFS